VEKSWLRLATKISDYDRFVRGITSGDAVRSKLEALDNIRPLHKLQETKLEIEHPEESGQQSKLLPALRRMFKAPMYANLRSVIDQSSVQVRRLSFSFVLRALLAYVLHQEIFSVEEQASSWRTMEKCLNAGKSFFHSLQMNILTKG
jgi:hypothetical protein